MQLISDFLSTEIDTSEHVVITYMTTGDKPTGTQEELDNMLSELNAILTEKVNAELEIYFIEWTDYLSNYNLTLAQMDGTVDLVDTASDWLDAWPNAKNGAFLELSEDMLKTYAPQIWASVPAENWEWTKEAGLTDGVKSWEDLTTYWKYVKDTYTSYNHSQRDQNW